MEYTETAKYDKKIFPAEVMDETIYDHFNRHYSSSRRLYLFTLALISLCFVSMFFIKVPVSIQSAGVLTAINEGSLLRAPGSGNVAELSFDSGLIARVYVNPGDIVFIREGMDVVFRVDAYDYNLWGLVQGVVTEISDDAVFNDETPMFSVRCALRSNSLTLKNGYTGTLKKGMTVQAGFHIAERTLFQLLYDKVDDWVTPQDTVKPFINNDRSG